MRPIANQIEDARMRLVEMSTRLYRMQTLRADDIAFASQIELGLKQFEAALKPADVILSSLEAGK